MGFERELVAYQGAHVLSENEAATGKAASETHE